MKNSNKESEETINYQLKMKRPVLLLLLGVLMCLPLTEAKANYYYKVQLQRIGGTEVRPLSDWIYSEDPGSGASDKVWINSLERLVKGETVKDLGKNDISLKENDNIVYKVVGLYFQGRQEENYDILQSDDYKFFDKIRKDVKYLNLSEWGKTEFSEDRYFQGMESLTEIVLPNNSFAIGDLYMFANCSNLTTITWGAKTTVTAIGKGAFKNCCKLQKEHIQRMIYEVSAPGPGGKGIVYGKIGDEAFYRCFDIETIIIPATIRVIGDEAFCQNKETSKFRQIDLPAGTIAIGKKAFQGCEVLTTVGMSKDKDNVNYNQKITKLGEAAFADCRSINSTSVNNIIASYAQNSVETIKVNGNDVKYIPAFLFYGCNGKNSNSKTNKVQTNFTELTIPAEFGAIGKGAFGGNEKNHPINSITVSKGVAPVCGKPVGDFLSGDPTSFQNIVPNKVTITFNGDANGYAKDGTSGYKTYQNESEFKRLLTKTLDENNTTYDVYPQMHAIVELKRTFKKGWNTLALPFGSPSSGTKDTDCAEIYKNALNPNKGNDFMIAAYRGLKNGTVFTFLKYAHVETDPLDEFEPILVKMSEADANRGTYTFENVDLNYDHDNTPTLYKPEELPGCVDSNRKKFNGEYDGGKPFFSGNDYNTFYFDGTFSQKKSDDPAIDFIKPGDYIIQGGKFIECTTDNANKYALKGFRGWFKRFSQPQYSKGNVITIELCDNDGTVTEIVNIDNNGNATIPYNIYNVYGQKVRGNTQSTEGLARGIYIVNGKKVMVK